MASERLPRKVLLPLGGKTVLARVIERVKPCPLVDEIVIATTDQPEDEVIVQEATKNGVKHFRGDLNDVLLRYYGAACASQADVIVRITSDCPLFDPELLTEMLKTFQQRNGQVDYLSNVIKRSYPRGLDSEIFTFAALKKMHEQARQPFEREHVTAYFYRNPAAGFRLENYEGKEDLSRYRWTLDTPEDYQLLQAIYDGVNPITTEAVLKFLKERPELVKLNAHVEQKKLA